MFCCWLARLSAGRQLDRDGAGARLLHAAVDRRAALYARSGGVIRHPCGARQRAAAAWGDLPIVVSVGLLQMLANATLVIFALRFVPPGRSSVLGYTTPLWVIPLAMLLGERPTARTLGGTFLGLAGMALLFSPTSLDWGNRQMVFGQILLMLAAIAWSICIVHIRGHRWQASPLDLAPWQMLLAAAPLAIAAPLVDGPAPGDFGPGFWMTTLYIGVLATAFAFRAVVEANRRLSATTTSNAMLAVPRCGADCFRLRDRGEDGFLAHADLARAVDGVPASDRRPELPVILATGYSSYASEVVAEGFALIEKPDRRDVL